MLESFFTLPLHVQLFAVYMVIINILTFFYFGFDKMRSLRAERRVSEKMLWGLSVIGGSIGALLGMNYFRHKTKKISFQAGMAVILALQVVVLVFVFS